jgi:hypothetical protein
MKITLRTLEDWKQILAQDTRGTVYERRHGIASGRPEFDRATWHDGKTPVEDFYYIHHHKGDGTITLKVLFRVVQGKDAWFCWTPTKNHARALGEFVERYIEVEVNNGGARLRAGEWP